MRGDGDQTRAESGKVLYQAVEDAVELDVRRARCDLPMVNAKLLEERT